MIFRPEHYHQAALERIKQAEILYQAGQGYALAMYTAGLAVESMLRAFRTRRDPSFDERHDLRLLFKASGMPLIDLSRSRREGAFQTFMRGDRLQLQSLIDEVSALWTNDLRYASEDRLRARLRELRLHQGHRGDIRKANALRLLQAAKRFVTAGDSLWRHSAKK